jgi:hypothetical protein
MGPQQRKKPAAPAKKKAHGGFAAPPDAHSYPFCALQLLKHCALTGFNPPSLPAEKKREDTPSPCSSCTDSDEEFSDEQEDEEDYKRGEGLPAATASLRRCQPRLWCSRLS